MYIEQAFKGQHEWWRYVVGVLIAIAGIFMFSVPHAGAIALKQLKGDVDITKLDDVNYLMSLFESNFNLVLILLPFAGGLIALLLAVKYLHKQSLTHLTTSREKIDWKRFWYVFIFWGILSSGLVLMDYYMNPDHYLINFNLKPFLILCVIAILLVPLQTSFEEYLFRGYLMQGLGSAYKTTLGAITCDLFGIWCVAYCESRSGKTGQYYHGLLYWNRSVFRNHDLDG